MASFMQKTIVLLLWSVLLAVSPVSAEVGHEDVRFGVDPLDVFPYGYQKPINTQFFNLKSACLNAVNNLGEKFGYFTQCVPVDPETPDSAQYAALVTAGSFYVEHPAYQYRFGSPFTCPAETLCYAPTPSGDRYRISTATCRTGHNLITRTYRSSSGISTYFYYCAGSATDPGDPGDGEPGDGEPGDGEPGDGEPGDGDPGTGEPGDGDPGTGEPGDGDPGTGGGSGGDGDGGDGDSDGGTIDDGSDGSGVTPPSERSVDESECGIGLKFQDGRCRSIPDNCGYINGVYACANPEPPSGCGSVNDIPGCYEAPPGCGYFNGEYGCFDSDDSVNCEGGILINGVCNKEGQQPISCPVGYTWDGTTCRNSATSCPIGSHHSGITGQCEPDDCPAGFYMLGGVCLDIPPLPDAPPGTPNDGPGTGNDTGSPDDLKVDLSSVNSRLDSILNANKTGFSNTVNAQNKTTDAVESLHQTNKKILSEIDELGKSVDSLKESVDEVKESIDELVVSVPDSDKNKPVDDADSSMGDSFYLYESGYDELIDTEFSVQGDSLKTDFLDVIPQYSSCGSISIPMPFYSMSISCERLEQFKRLFGWVLYVWTVIYLFNLALKPVGER